MLKPRPFLLCFDAHRADRKVWSVRVGARGWRCAEFVQVRVPVETHYRGQDARQPRAYLYGVGVVRSGPTGLQITAA